MPFTPRTRVQTLHSGRNDLQLLGPSSRQAAAAPGSAPGSGALETPLAPEIVALRDSEGTGFGRDDRYSGFWGSRRPGWPAWSTSSATIAALRGSEGRLLGG